MTERRIIWLDGLRAVAFVAVLAFHSEIGPASTGWLGVDVFFVLSGYLITGILLRERERTGRIQIGRFYLRRAFRLYPALILTVVACLPWARMFGDVDYGFGLTAALALTYTTNLWIAWRGTTGGGLAHTWSLGIEEQFYLLWPLALLFLHTRRVLIQWTVVASIASFGGFCLIDDRVLSNTAGLVLPYTRAWEMLLGAALAAWHPILRRSLVKVVVAVGLAGFGCVIMVGWFVFPTTAPGVGLQSLAVTASTLLLLAGGTQQASLATRFLGSGLLVWIGQRSYAMYLFHVPLLTWIRHSQGSPTMRFALVGLLAAVLADLSLRWVERPATSWLARRQDRATGSTLSTGLGSATGPEVVEVRR